MPANPFGNPGSVAAIAYDADKGDGAGVQTYVHEFPARSRPRLSGGPGRNLTLKGGSYSYLKHGGRLWLQNPPGQTPGALRYDPTVKRGGALPKGSQMAKRGKLSGSIKFIGHGGGSFFRGRHNPPLLVGSMKQWLIRGASVAGGGALYFGGKWALDRFAPTLDARIHEGALVAGGVAGVFGVRALTRDWWAALGFGVIPVGLGGYRLARMIYAGLTAPAAAAPAGATTTRGIGESIGEGDLITDDFGRPIGRVRYEVTDSIGRPIGAMLDDGDDEVFVSMGRIISRVPKAISQDFIGRIPKAISDDFISRVPMAVSDSLISAVPIP